MSSNDNLLLGIIAGLLIGQFVLVPLIKVLFVYLLWRRK